MLVDSANLVDLIVLVEGSGVVENSSVELENNNSAALNHETSVEEAATSKPIEVDEGENETEASSSEESIGADAAGIATKRTSNNPYDVNSTWVHFDSDDLGAFKQTPVRLNLDGRAFYVSVHLKLFDCRLNIGDIVTTFDNTRAVFLGVRLSKQAEEGNRTVLYFCTLPTDDINAGK